jgi:hypothetical protein
MRCPRPLSFGFGQQQHLLAQLPEFGDHPLSFAGTGQVAHALVSVGGFHVAVEHELDAVEVFGSAHQERAADAERARGAAHAQTGEAAMTERNRVETTVALEDLTRAFIPFCYEPFDPLGFLLWLDDAQSQRGVVG